MSLRAMKILTFDKRKKTYFFLRLCSLNRTFMLLRIMKVGCIREPTVIGHESGKDKNSKNFILFFHSF